MMSRPVLKTVSRLLLGLTVIGLLAGAEPRIALVIGNSNYADSPLPNPVNDARDITATLKAVGFDVIPGENLTQAAMIRAIDAFGQRLRHGGVGLFYFAGHGMQVKGDNYLIPVGARINKELDVEVEAVRLARVLNEMDEAKNRLNIVILDACRNNPFARSFRSGKNGLGIVDAPAGTLIAYATQTGNTASDGSGRNGLYTQELLAAVRAPGLKVEDVFKRVELSNEMIGMSAGANAGKKESGGETFAKNVLKDRLRGNQSSRTVEVRDEQIRDVVQQAMDDVIGKITLDVEKYLSGARRQPEPVAVEKQINGRVIDVDGPTVFITGINKSLVRIGDRLFVRRTRVKRDTVTGKNITLSDKIGEVEIVEIQDEVVVGSFSGSGKAQDGDIITNNPSGASAPSSSQSVRPPSPPSVNAPPADPAPQPERGPTLARPPAKKRP